MASDSAITEVLQELKLDLIIHLRSQECPYLGQTVCASGSLDFGPDSVAMIAPKVSAIPNVASVQVEEAAFCMAGNVVTGPARAALLLAFGAAS
jgi:hypothetical protein